MQKNEAFDRFVEEFKKLDLVDKKQMVIDEMRNTLALGIAINNNLGSKGEVLINREVIDVKNDLNEKDFVEAVFVYLYSIRESLAQSFNCAYDRLNNDEEEF